MGYSAFKPGILTRVCYPSVAEVGGLPIQKRRDSGRQFLGNHKGARTLYLNGCAFGKRGIHKQDRKKTSKVIEDGKSFHGTPFLGERAPNILTKCSDGRNKIYSLAE
jgi:hypothetical protein